MPTPTRRAGTPRSVAAESGRLLQRVGHKWNRYDKLCLRDSLEVARDVGVPSAFAEYGFLRMRYDFVPMGVQLAAVEQTATVASGDSSSTVAMQVDQPGAAGSPAQGAPAAAAAVAPAVPPPAPAASAMDTEDTTPSDEMVRLRAKVEHARAKKKRYRKGLRVRKATEKADAAAAAAAASSETRFHSAPAAAAPAPPPPPPAFTFGSVPAATSVGTSTASASAPAATSAGMFAFSMGSDGPSCATARPAGRAAGTPPGLAPTPPVPVPSAVPQALPPADGQGQGPPVYCAAFGGHMPYVDACRRLVEDVTAACCARGRAVARTCLFSRGPRRELMVLGSSRAARMSERDLGAKLASCIDEGLTPEALARLKDWLCESPTEVGFPGPRFDPGTPAGRGREAGPRRIVLE